MRSGKPISATTLPKMLQHHRIAAVAHGFRSSFRDWAVEETDREPEPRRLQYAALRVLQATLAMAAGMTTELHDMDWLLGLVEATEPPPQRRGALPAARGAAMM